MVAFVAMALTTATAVGAAVYRFPRGGPVTAVRAAVTTRSTWTATTSTFTSISGSAVSLTVPSGQHAILVIAFSSEERCLGVGYCHLAAYVDGVRVIPQDVRIDCDCTSFQWHAVNFQWVTGVLGPGQHSVTMAGRLDDTLQMDLGSRTLTVESAKA
jgi:hypothetical protein